jgi:hypothetical protein
MMSFRTDVSAVLLVVTSVLSAALCLSTACSRAPKVEWRRHYGGEGLQSGHGVKVTYDGGYILTGCTQVNKDRDWDVLVLRTNRDGDTLWTRVYGSSNDEYGYNVLGAATGDYVVAGYAKSGSGESGQIYVWLLRLDADGDSLWTRTYTGHDGRPLSLGAAIQTRDGGYAIVGSAKGPSERHTRMHVIKTDELGHPLWSASYGDSNWSSGRDITETSDGGFALTGTTPMVPGAYPQICLTRIGSEGELIFSKTYGPEGVSHGFSCLETKEHRFLICGTTHWKGDNRILLILTDSNGDALWTREYTLGKKYFTPDSQLNRAWAIASPPDGFTVYGVALKQGRGVDPQKIVFLIEVDFQGRVRWTRYLEEPNHWLYVSLDRGSSGEYILGGSTFISRSLLGGQAQLIKLGAE